jgi:VanZ family protein
MMSPRKIIAVSCGALWTKALSGICLSFIVFYSLIPQTERLSTGIPGKDEHVLAYSVTGLLLGLSFRTSWGPVLAAAILSAQACILEFLQQWAPGRHPRVSDAIVGAAAGALGALGSSCLRRYAEKRYAEK